ncbi:MAG: class I SAM-dependent methyltransferase [Cyclobacterium sp.]|uniref:class I SAM-dependent methyltransferase n=1 Tax=unclassified Cyclobacterium TaxID=2615055 RepID=UPI0013D0A1A2|nr:class I SAM-dependent methyltransferase [Cyclobacterium sp. SYSU L10401]
MRETATTDHYRLLAPFYERLGSLLFGNEFQASKLAFLDSIGRGDQVLVLGGGAGSNMREILNRCGSKGKVIYMEASASMIRECQSGLSMDLLQQVTFIHAASFDALPDMKFDVVFTQYFLDVLPDEKIDQLFRKIQTKVQAHSHWIFADFYPVPSKMLLLKTLINSFRILTRHPRRDLPEYGYYFEKWGWEERGRSLYCQGFYQASIYGFAPRSIKPETSSLK